MMAIPADTDWLDDLMPQVGAAPAREPAIREIEALPSVLDCATAEVSWTVQGMIADGTVCVLTSEPGSGKTTFALGLADAVAHGTPFAGMRTTRRPVLVLDRENSAAFVADVLKRMGAKDGGPLWLWGGWCAESAADLGSGIVQTWVLHCPVKPLIVVDSLVAFNGADENDAAATRTYMQRARFLADMGAVVVFLHHSGKGESSADYRGSSDIKAAADSCWKLANIGPSNRIERLRLKPFKSRFLVEPEILLHYSDGVFTRESGGGSQRATDAELLQELLTKNPGIIGKEVERLAAERGVSRSYARTWLANRLRDGAVHGARGVNNARFYTWAGESTEDDNAIPF